MDVISLMKQSAALVWRRKILWFFGFFLVGGAGAAGGNGRGGPSGGHPLPGWLLPVIASLVVVALIALVMHVVSEAAVIEGVRCERRGEPFGMREGFHAGFRHFWRVLGIKLLAAFAVLAVGVTVVAPALAAAFHVVPLWLGLPVTLLLALAAVPLVVTGYFVYAYALRFAVLDGATVGDAVHSALEWIHGRLLASLLLLVASGVGAFLGGVIAFLALLPAAAVGVAIYFLAGLVPAIVAGLSVLLPMLVPLAGLIGAYGSTVWTQGFLDERKAV